jgi:hypothetical protein
MKLFIMKSLWILIFHIVWFCIHHISHYNYWISPWKHFCGVFFLLVSLLLSLLIRSNKIYTDYNEKYWFIQRVNKRQRHICSCKKEFSYSYEYVKLLNILSELCVKTKDNWFIGGIPAVCSLPKKGYNYGKKVLFKSHHVPRRG